MSKLTQWVYRTLLALAVVALSACSTVSGWFGDDEADSSRQPAELVDIDESVRIKKLWSKGVGNGQGDGGYKLQPVIHGDIIYAASANGKLLAIDRYSGEKLWKVDLDTELSGGVGVYEDALFLGTGDGLVIKVDASNGERLWATRLHGEVLAPPVANAEVVVAQTYDGKLQGLDFDSGEQLWVYDSNLPVLTLRGTSTPLLYNGVVFAAFANGRVLAFKADSGAIGWESRVAISQGRSEIERIVDVDGSMEVIGMELYAVSYQGRLVAVDVKSGRKLWQQNTSSYSGVSTGFGNVYVADASGTLTAYLRNGRGVRWRQELLAYRDLSRPTVIGSYLAVADYEGIVHIVSQVDGEFVGRVKVDGDGAKADMISDGSTLYVYGNSGKLVAYEITAEE